MLNILLSVVTVLAASVADLKATGAIWRAASKGDSFPFPLIVLMKSSPEPKSGAPDVKPLMSVTAVMNFIPSSGSVQRMPLGGNGGAGPMPPAVAGGVLGGTGGAAPVAGARFALE